MQSHRQQGDGHLFAGGQQHVHLPLRRIAVDGASLGGEFIGGVAHGRHHDHEVIAVFLASGDALGNGLNALNAANGGAAEFLHQQSHPCRFIPEAIVSLRRRVPVKLESRSFLKEDLLDFIAIVRQA